MEGFRINSRRVALALAFTVLICLMSVQTCAAYWYAGTINTSDYEWPVDIVACRDGGFAIAGSTLIGSYNFLLIKTDRLGRMNWIHTYDTNENEYALGLTECADGGFVLVGHIEHDKAWIVRTNSYGGPIWNTTISIEGTSTAELWDIIELPTGELVAAGYIRNQTLNYADAWLVGIKANGTLKWSKTFSNISQHQLCKTLIYCQNGDLMLVGDTANSANNLQNLWMIRASSSGDVIWQRTFNREGNEDFTSAIETNDGGFALTGQLNGNRMFLLRTDSFGNLLWNKIYTGSEVYLGSGDFLIGEDTAGRDVVECEDNGFAILGATNSFANFFPNNIWIVRTNDQGSPIWNYTIKSDSSDRPAAMAMRSDTNFVIASGTRESVTSGEYDIVIIIVPDEAPYTPSTTPTTQDISDMTIPAVGLFMICGSGIVIALILYSKYKRGDGPHGS